MNLDLVNDLTMFKIKFLPARFGDCLWIEYGNENTSHRILVDGGTKGTLQAIRQEIELLPADQRHFDLVVVTHIDQDHIEGVLSLLEEEVLFTADDFWFNSWKHLPGNPDDENFSAVQGERLTTELLKRQTAGSLSWNQHFQNKAVVIPATGELPVRTLPGGMKLTLLSPTNEKLSALRNVWDQEIRKAGLDPGFGEEVTDEETDDESFEAIDLPDVDQLALAPFSEDEAAPNGSSIAFLAEFEGKRVLLTGDAHPSLLVSSLNRLFPDQRVALDLFKLSHHGSEGNTSPALLQKIDCSRFVFSTNGSRFGHPKPITVSRVIKTGGAHPELIFNYRKDINKMWDLPLLKNKFNYQTRFPADGQEGIDVFI